MKNKSRHLFELSFEKSWNIDKDEYFRVEKSGAIFHIRGNVLHIIFNKRAWDVSPEVIERYARLKEAKND